MNKNFAKSLYDTLIYFRLNPTKNDYFGFTYERVIGYFKGTLIESISDREQQINASLDALSDYLSSDTTDTAPLPDSSVQSGANYYTYIEKTGPEEIQKDPGQTKWFNDDIGNKQSLEDTPLGQAANFVTDKVVNKATRAGLQKLLTRFASAAKFITGPLAAAIVAAQIAQKTISWLKRNGKYILAAIGALIGWQLLGGLGGIVGAGAGYIFGGGTLGGLFLGVGGTVGGAIGLPLAITLILLSVVVTLVIFIINSGAYIVPPLPSSLISGAVESQFIDIKKTASPAGPFENTDLPLEITYTVEIRAKKGTLTNLSFDNSCQVTKEGPAPSCEGPVPEEIPNEISPVNPFSFSYTQTYEGSAFEDSFVSDTFNVVANAPGQDGARAAATATVKIGEPPEECPSGWPVASGSITRGAYSTSTHAAAEAIDIGVATGNQVTARHSGVAQVFNSNNGNPFGKHVKIQSSCNGVTFISLYAHLDAVEVSNGFVNSGQTVGRSGSTGNSTGPHLHYEFRIGSISSSRPAKYPDNPPYMWTPYIPKNVPRGCAGSCNTALP